MQSEDSVVRRDIVKLLGLLFGSQRSRLAEDIPELWTAYMARYNDVGEEVRLVCVTLSLNILIYHPELRGQVSGRILPLKLADASLNQKIVICNCKR